MGCMVIVNAFPNEAAANKGTMIKMLHFPANGQGIKTI